MANQKAEFANLICRFGDKAVMLDYFNEIVGPAFFGKSRAFTRRHGKAFYFFHNVQLLTLDDEDGTPSRVLAGRIVRKTTLESQQVFVAGHLRATRQSLETAPSSFFLLVLQSHRLVFVREMHGAPNPDQFALLLEHNARMMWQKLVRFDDYWLNSNLSGPLTLKERERVVPKPSVDVVPFASDDSIDEQVHRFSLLRELDIVFRGTNHELNNSEFFGQWHDTFEELDASEASLKFKSPEGLQKDRAKEEVKLASTGGTQRIRLRGLDLQGHKLAVDDSDFTLVRELDKKLGRQVPAAARKLYRGFLKVVREGFISAGATDAATMKKVEGIDS